MIRKLLCAALWLAALPLLARADDVGISSFQTLSQSTSDGMVHRLLRADYRNHRRDSYWPYAGESPSGFDVGVVAEYHTGSLDPFNAYRGTKAAGVLGMKFNEALRTDFSAGMHQLERPDDPSSRNRLPLSSRARRGTRPRSFFTRT